MLCGNRRLLIDNKTKDPLKKSEQVKELLDFVNEIVDNNGGKPYIDQRFLGLTAGVWSSLKQVFFRILNQAFKMAFGVGAISTSPWEKPPEGWLKINTDGGRNQRKNRSVIGGVCRNYKGEWVWGFSVSMPYPHIEESEARALKKGLELARERHIARVVMEIDCELVFKLVKKEDVTTNTVLRQIVEDCKELINRDRWDVRISLVGNEHNVCASILSKLSYGTDIPETNIWHYPPPEVHELVAMEMN